MRYSLLRPTLLVCLGFIADRPVADAQSEPWCPPANTVVVGHNTLGDFTTTWKGSDPSDQTICISVSEGPGAGVNNGKTIRRIYGWFDLTNYIWKSSEEEAARNELAAILSGQASNVSFDLNLGRPGSSYVWGGTETWKRIGNSSLSVGGHPMQVIELEDSFKGGANTYYDGSWALWYDPASHLFVREKLTLRLGTSSIQEAEVLSIKYP